jgi:hypothetical protein
LFGVPDADVQRLQLGHTARVAGDIHVVVAPDGMAVATIAAWAVLGVTYLALVAGTLPQRDGGFSTLAGVRRLSEEAWALLAG